MHEGLGMEEFRSARWRDEIVFHRRSPGAVAPASRVERAMLAMTIVALPAENHFLFLPGFSILFVLSEKSFDIHHRTTAL